MFGDVEPRRGNSNRQRRCQGDGQQRCLFSFQQGILISGVIADPERHFHNECIFEGKVVHCFLKLISLLLILT